MCLDIELINLEEVKIEVCVKCLVVELCESSVLEIIFKMICLIIMILGECVN